MRVVNLPTLYSTFNKAQRCFGCFFRFYCAFKAINDPVLFVDGRRFDPHGFIVECFGHFMISISKRSGQFLPVTYSFLESGSCAMPFNT